MRPATSDNLVIEAGLGFILILKDLFCALCRLLPDDSVGDGDGRRDLDDVFAGADEGEHPAFFLAFFDKFLDGCPGPFQRGIFIAVGDDGYEDCCVFEVLDVVLQLLDSLADGVEEGSAAAGLVLLFRERFGFRDRGFVVDHVDAAVAEGGEGDEMLLRVHVLELGGADGAEGLVVSVDGFLADRFHRAGLVKDNEVENRGGGKDSVLHNKIVLRFWGKDMRRLYHFVVQGKLIFNIYEDEELSRIIIIGNCLS